MEPLVLIRSAGPPPKLSSFKLGWAFPVEARRPQEIGIWISVFRHSTLLALTPLSTVCYWSCRASSPASQDAMAPQMPSFKQNLQVPDRFVRNVAVGAKKRRGHTFTGI